MRRFALKTALRCMIPVAVLAAMVIVLYCSPQARDQLYQSIAPSLLSAIAWIGIVIGSLSAMVASIVKSTGCLLDVSTIGLCTVYFWICCVLNHLKKQNLTEGFYQQLSIAWKISTVAVMVLLYAHCFNLTGLMFPGHEADYTSRCLSVFGLIMAYAAITVYTENKNQLLSKSKK
jgi:hypothetical protein